MFSRDNYIRYWGPISSILGHYWLLWHGFWYRYRHLCWVSWSIIRRHVHPEQAPWTCSVQESYHQQNGSCRIQTGNSPWQRDPILPVSKEISGLSTCSDGRILNYTSVNGEYRSERDVSDNPEEAFYSINNCAIKALDKNWKLFSEDWSSSFNLCNIEEFLASCWNSK